MILNERAYWDLNDIFEYLAGEKDAPESAKKQTDRIWKALKALATFPYAHQERLIGKFAGQEYRQLLIDNYIAIYKIEEEDKIVKVITIQYQKRSM